MDDKVTKSELNHEKILNLLKTSADLVLDAYAEPAAVVITVLWQPELGEDLPAGMVITKKGTTNADVLGLLTRLVQQNAKMGEQLVNVLQSKLKELAQKVKEFVRQAEKTDASQIRSTSKESDNVKEIHGPVDSGPFAPGTT